MNISDNFSCGNIKIDRKQNSQIGNINLDWKKILDWKHDYGIENKNRELETMNLDNLQFANKVRRLETVNREIENTIT